MRKSKRPYFNEDTEEAVRNYLATQNQEEKNKIYTKHIHPAFLKLTENLIHVFKIRNTDVDDLSHLQQEVIIFLMENLHKFKPEKNKKAYSYFNTVALNYLINYNNKNYKKRIQNFSLAESFETEKDMKNSTNLDDINKFSNNINDGDDENKLSLFLDKFTQYYVKKIENEFYSPEDRNVAYALMEILINVDKINIFHKRAISLYLKEMVDVPVGRISKVKKHVYSELKKRYIYYLENDIFDF